MSSGYGLTGGMLPLGEEKRQKRERRHAATTLPSIESKHKTLTTFTSTGPSRCFPFWQDVLACYVVNTSTEDDSGKKKCSPVLEDYYECLHHRKEVRYTNLLRV
jgi:hypothetical protein